MSADNDLIRHVRLVGRAGGLVKNFPGFDKKRHTVPDAATPATNGFLAKLCAGELAETAETFFQKARAELKYKRKELSLAVESPAALLAARDFSHEWIFEINPTAPAEYTLTRTLRSTGDNPLPCTPEFDALFSGAFEEIIFSLTKPVRVEAVIDAVEALDAGENQPAVDYPSDCRHCTLRVPGIAAEVVFTGAELTMKFPAAGSPRELAEKFLKLRHAFSLTKSSPLSEFFNHG